VFSPDFYFKLLKLLRTSISFERYPLSHCLFFVPKNCSLIWEHSYAENRTWYRNSYGQNQTREVAMQVFDSQCPNTSEFLSSIFCSARCSKLNCSIEITGWQENISMYQMTGKHIESNSSVTTRKQLGRWFGSGCLE
jgi:hypothetical protein